MVTSPKTNVEKLANLLGVVALAAALLAGGSWYQNQRRRRPEAPYRSYDEPAFGSSGIVENRAAVAARAVSVLPDRKILVAGIAEGPSQFDIALIRYAPDGTLDGSFGTGGVLTLDFGGAEQVNAMALGEGGKIWLAGEFTAGSGAPTMGVVRLEPDGRPDSAFGTGGRALFPLKGEGGLARALVLDSGGGAILAGFVESDSVRKVAVARVRADGKWDTAFGKGGLAELALGNRHSEAFAVGRQQDGKIVVAAYSRPDERLDFAVVRFSAEGSPDPTFGEHGTAYAGFPSLSSYPYAMRLLPSDGILVAGMSGSRSDYDIALAQWESDGKLDPKFGDAGRVLVPIGAMDDAAYALLRQPNGKILAVGSSASSKLPNALSLVKLQPGGAPDSSFGLEGKVVTAVQSYAGYALDVQPNGKIVVAGNRVDWAVGNIGIFVARYLPDGSLDAP